MCFCHCCSKSFKDRWKNKNFRTAKLFVCHVISNGSQDLVQGSTNIESTLKPGQKIRFDGHSDTIEQTGAFHIIMDNDKGETVVLPTKLIADKDIIIESGPQPEIPEKKIERMTEGVDMQSERKQ